MKVSDILRIKGHVLFTVPPQASLLQAVQTMAQHDIGSLVVMEQGKLVGMLTFSEIMAAVAEGGGVLGKNTVAEHMDTHYEVCGPETTLDTLRRTMLEAGVRYIPVMQDDSLLGVISFHDVAQAVVREQDFENQMLKAYIRDWPEDVDQADAQAARASASARG
ncbi:MAG: CBS domain-containing protein [Thiomonas sp.]|uniref:CBS domain-containing protein n=1 Tax=Thiomonas sp. TaxID=2047785 RepID=UPI002A35E560|nr:CBS domain-containing protein [Thiomonas sp.]MDY0330864.1 CBS domain-containing protein [Thiomonas sp.]